MFVLRAKAKLRDATGDPARPCWAWAAPARRRRAGAQWLAQLPAAPYAKVEGEHGTVIRLADAFGAPRYLWLTSAQTARRPARSCAPRWRWAATQPGAWPRSTPACRR
jgi:hypothetical protein